ncbi:DUF6382 domain-containing protein [Paenibacillus macerans]|uniref:DUF6382 domain-containing protein n=1 Tax=Paenibacillus macerans TaxID=44252 RepID=UPI003D31CD13
MPELYADFVRDGGTYMILKAREGLRADHLNRVQRAMLAAVSVPNLLRLDIREVDFEVSLHYDITGKRMLSQCLKCDKIDMPEFYSLLLQVVCMLEDCKRYMLAPAHFLLDEEHIFVEEPLSCGILHFSYVPWKEPQGKAPLAQTLIALITRLITCVSRVEGDGIQQLLRFCGDELFSLGELKKMLLQRLSGEQDGEDGAVAAGRTNPGLKQAASARRDVRNQGNDRELQRKFSQFQRQGSMPGDQAVSFERSTVIKEYLPAETPDGSGAAYFNGGGAGTGGAGVDGQEPWLGMDEEGRTKPPIKKTYFVLGVILADALCWKFLYLDRPGRLSLFTGIAVTLVLVMGAFWLWRNRLAVTGVGAGLGAPELSAVLEDSDVRGSMVPFASNLPAPAAFAGRPYDDLVAPAPSGSSVSSVTPVQSVPTAGDVLDDMMAIRPMSSLFAPASRQEKEDLPLQPDIPTWDKQGPDSPPTPPTVMLSRSMLQEQGRDSGRTARYYLERYDSAGARPDRIPMLPGSFVIGRSEEIVQYVENTAGVSRAHAEVMVTAKGCFLKDLGSKNGTRLKGELIAPYKEYALEPGDVFALADASFKLGMES